MGKTIKNFFICHTIAHLVYEDWNTQIHSKFIPGAGLKYQVRSSWEQMDCNKVAVVTQQHVRAENGVTAPL